MQDTAYKHTGLTGCHRFRLQKLCQVGRFAKKRSKGNILCQIGTYQIVIIHFKCLPLHAQIVNSN